MKNSPRSQHSESTCHPISNKCCFGKKKCPTKMHFVLLTMLFFLTSQPGHALQLLRLEVPHIADPRWEKIALRCEYDLNGMDLYSVKWYKDGAEFFRYMPGSDPVGRAFTVEGVRVDVSRSDSKQVVLLGQRTSTRKTDKISLTGSYGCEVSTEGPSFLTTYGEANMSVAVPPKFPPALEGLRPYYEVTEMLKAECISAPSYPSSLLTFFLNGKEVSKELTKELPEDGQMEGSLVSASRVGLSFRLERQHFPGGSLSLVCESTLPDIPGASTLKTEETAMLAVSNQRLAQEPPKSIISGSVKVFYFSINNNMIIFLKIIYSLSNTMNFH